MSFSKRLPAPLSQRIASASTALYARMGREFDVAIGGVPFMLASVGDLPQSIETIKVRKDQFDVEDPGEQSLTGWWRRSQASFHEGAGMLYQESASANTPGNGFYESSGVSVFDQGRLTLLKKMKAATVTGTSYTRMRSFSSGFSAVADGTFHKASAISGPFAAFHSPAGKTITDGLIAGTSFYDVASDGTLYQGSVSDPAGATAWPCGATTSRLGWGKYRLWVIGGRSMWQPNLSLVGGSAQNPIFTNPNLGWTYTCLAEGPAAMYFGGHDGFASSIQAVTFDSGGGLPALSGASVTAVLPDGELVQELAVLAGEYIGIGTSRGFRVGVINTDASITYGPLLVEPPGVTACTAVGCQGRFFMVAFATASGNAMAYRIDTATQLSDSGGVFPYAADIDLGFAGNITSLVAASTTQLGCTANDGKVYYQSTTEYVDIGYIQTGRIRFRTTEPKDFRFVGVGIEPLHGTIQASIIKSNLSPDNLGTISVQGDVFTDSFRYEGQPMEFAAVKLQLAPTVDKLSAPVVNSILVRALPAVTPQRLITLPLLCYDKEQSRSGQRYGGESFAADRLNAMLVLEDAGVCVTYQDFVGGTGNHQVVIESLRFVATTPDRGANQTGGLLLMELRTVDL